MSEMALPQPAPHGVTKDLEGHSAVESRHMILIDKMIMWQLMNPGKPWTQFAAAEGLSVMWCRMVASADAFKARYAEQSEKLMLSVGLYSVKEKVRAAAEATLERIVEKVPLAESLEDLTDAAEVLLDAHYKLEGANPAPARDITINQQIIMDGKAALEAGRKDSSPPPIEVLPS
jgi:hypothetical protein